MSDEIKIDSLGWLLEDLIGDDKDARRELYFLAHAELSAGAKRAETVTSAINQPVTVSFSDVRLLNWLVGELARVGPKLPSRGGRPDTVDSDFRIALEVARHMKLDGQSQKVAVSAVAKATLRKWQTVDRIFRRYRARAYKWIANEPGTGRRAKNLQ